MWRVLIADDEPKIRKGLKSFINWSDFDMEIIGEAEDGEMAYEMAVELKPDLMLVDICMPFLSGLELIEKLKTSLPSCIIIVVTGHDEFNYAQKALRFHVFDYLLKPVAKDVMTSVLNEAKNDLLNRASKDSYSEWAEEQLKKSLPYLKENFFKDWVSGRLNEAEIREQLDFHKIDIAGKSGMLVIKVSERFNKEQLTGDTDANNTLSAVKDLVGEIIKEQTPNVVFMDDKNNLIAIVPIVKQSEWVILGEKIQQVCDKCLSCQIILAQEVLKNDIADITPVYKKLVEDINASKAYTPVVLLAKKYIDTYYYKDDISLQEVADEIQVSPTYLSRLLKQEIGVSFVEYLTQVRVKKAIQLMNDPVLKIYEIAERVGYSSQHYFSTAFKKILDVSPAEYRKGGLKN